MPESKAFGTRVDRIDQIAVHEPGVPWVLRADGTWAQTTLLDVTPALPQTDRPNGKLVQAVAARSGGLWLVSEWGVHRYKDGQWLFHEPFPSRIGTSSGGLEDSEGNPWVATWSEGLWRFGAEHHFQQMALGKFPNSETVRSIFEDAEGNIWVGTEASAIRIHWDLQGLGDRIPREQGIHLFRIVQEAVHNVVKHSHAATCEVRVTREPGVVQVEVVDDGRGFDLGGGAEPGGAASGNGLSNIRERARLLGARLDFRTAPTFGTRIVVRIPVDPSREGMVRERPERAP